MSSEYRALWERRQERDRMQWRWTRLRRHWELAERDVLAAFKISARTLRRIERGETAQHEWYEFALAGLAVKRGTFKPVGPEVLA